MLEAIWFSPFAKSKKNPRWLKILALALLGLYLLGCPEAWRSRQQRSPTSLLWIGSNSMPLEASDVARLKELGVEEAIATVARLDFGADRGPLVALEDFPSPPSMPLTLAVSGEWRRQEDQSQVAEEVAEGARQLRFAAEGRGALPVGLHFDLKEVDDFENFADFLKQLRKKLDRTLFLSVSIQRPWLRRDGIKEVARAVDYVVPFLYGQRVYEAEEGRAWDFIDLEKQLQLIEEMDVPYMLGVVSLGTAAHLTAEGQVKARMTPISLEEILWNRNLKLRPGFSLEGVNRRVYAVAAERSTEVGKWSVKPGEMVRVVRAATSDLEELMRLVGVWDIPNHLGQVYYRLPSGEEKLSLSLGNLLNALAPTPAQPDLRLDANIQRRTGRGWLVRFNITNQNGEITELSLMDSNYLEVRCLNGVFSNSQVDPADFYRYDLYRTSGDGELERTFRRSDLMRLHIPILAGQQEVNSGDIEVYVKGEPRFELSAQFLLPNGRQLSLGPQPWPAGSGSGGS